MVQNRRFGTRPTRYPNGATSRPIWVNLRREVFFLREGTFELVCGVGDKNFEQQAYYDSSEENPGAMSISC